MSLIEMAIAFVVNHPAVTSTIIGPRTTEQLESQRPATNVVPDEALLDRIDEIVGPGLNLKAADASYRASHRRLRPGGAGGSAAPSSMRGFVRRRGRGLPRRRVRLAQERAEVGVGREFVRERGFSSEQCRERSRSGLAIFSSHGQQGLADRDTRRVWGYGAQLVDDASSKVGIAADVWSRTLDPFGCGRLEGRRSAEGQDGGLGLGGGRVPVDVGWHQDEGAFRRVERRVVKRERRAAAKDDVDLLVPAPVLRLGVRLDQFLSHALGGEGSYADDACSQGVT
jgi:hypothetical protein